MFDFIWMLFLIYMLVNDANEKHPVAPGVLYVIHKYVFIKMFRTYIFLNFDYITEELRAETLIWIQACLIGR